MAARHATIIYIIFMIVQLISLSTEMDFLCLFSATYYIVVIVVVLAVGVLQVFKTFSILNTKSGVSLPVAYRLYGTVQSGQDICYTRASLLISATLSKVVYSTPSGQRRSINSSPYSFPFAFNGVFEFQNCEIQLNFCFCFTCLHVLPEKVCHDLATLLHK